MNKTNPILWEIPNEVKEGDIRAQSDAERAREQEMDREFGRQIMADREKYAQLERDILAKEKEQRLKKRREDYAAFRIKATGLAAVLRNCSIAASKWRDDLKFADTAELNEIRSLLKQMEKFTAPVGNTFSDELPISLPVRHDRPIPDGYHFADWTGTWMRDGY